MNGSVMFQISIADTIKAIALQEFVSALAQAEKEVSGTNDPEFGNFVIIMISLEMRKN